jgi:hypothetical protein
MIKKLYALGVLLLLAACGGSGGSGSSSSAGSTPAPTPMGSASSDFTTVTVDAGPSGLTSGIDFNVPFVSVTLCAPGSTTNCQTIDHLLVDTQSTGLRIFASVMSGTVLNALPLEMDTSGNPIGECFTFADGFVFGSVRQANFQIGGESVSSLPLQVIADAGVFSNPPSTCTSSGAANLDTVNAFGANGIIGVSVAPTDCSFCTTSGANGLAYYDCPSSGCSAFVTRSASLTAPLQQVINPVAVFPVDNNGTILSMPAVSASGQATASGTLFFGIGTESNNGLGSARIFTTDGAGNLTASFSGNSGVTTGFLDSGSNAYFFVDSSIPLCTASNIPKGAYCPASPTMLSPTLQGRNGASVSATFTLQNAQSLLVGNVTAIPGIGINPSGGGGVGIAAQDFDFGLPFFYGRPVFTAISGFSAAGTAGPWMGF